MVYIHTYMYNIYIEYQDDSRSAMNTSIMPIIIQPGTSKNYCLKS